MSADKAISVLGSEKWFQSDFAVGLVQIEVCRSALNFGILLLRCTLFWLFWVCAGLWRDDAVNSTAVCLLFHSVQLDQLSKRIQHWHLCQKFLGSTYLAIRVSAGAVLGTWVAPLQSRSCSVTSIRPLATEVLLHSVHRWITLFAPTSWLLVVPLSNDRWHRILKPWTQYSTSYSTEFLVCHLQLMLLLWQELLPAFAGIGPLKAQPIFDFTAHGAALSSDFLNSKGWWMS